jgi:membrane protease subunit HflK
VQYRVEEPIKYVMNVETPGALVRAAGQATLMRMIGTMEIESLLTTDRSRIEVLVLAGLQEELDRIDAGVRVITVKLQDVHPPLEVVGAFRDVASAREDKNRMINQAEAYRDSLTPEVRGLAAEMIAGAEAERTEAVERATGEARRFLQVVKEYRKHREVSSIRMYLETMERVLPGLEKYLVEPDAAGEPIDLRFFDEDVSGVRGGW